MKKKLYIWIALGLALSAAALIISTDRGGGNLSRSLRLEKPERIDRIQFCNIFDTTTIYREGESWYLEEHKGAGEELNRVAVENLLVAASGMEIISVSEGGEDFSGEFIVFYRADRVIKAYDLESRKGLMFLRTGKSDKVFRIGIPGFPGLDPAKIFGTDPDIYRDHLLFSLLPSEVKVIEVRKGPEQSFRLSQDSEGRVSCISLDEETVLPAGDIDEESVRRLFSYLGAVQYESVLPGESHSPSSRDKGEAPLALINIGSTGGEMHSLEVYAWHDNGAMEQDLHRALVYYNKHSRSLLMNYVFLDVLMRGPEHYYSIEKAVD